MTDETSAYSGPNGRRVDASSAATARKINRLPPGEYNVDLHARAVTDQMVLRIAAYSAELEAGTVVNLDRIFGQPPPSTDVKGKRAYASQGAFWLNVVTACGLQESELQDVTLAQLTAKITGKHVIAVINDAGYWSRVRPI